MIVTPLYCALLTLWFVLLSLLVIRRRRLGISLGDGGDPAMLRVIRGHANFAEYVPLALLMMLVLEISKTSLYALHVLGILLVAGRILHGYALCLTRRWRFGRTWGTVLTFVVLLAEAAMCLEQAVHAHALWARGLI